MGRIFEMEFEQPNPDYYFCKLCRTHIALAEDFNCIHLETELCGGVFNEVVNVRVDEPVHHWQVGDHTIADIYCIKCDDRLGWKYMLHSADSGWWGADHCPKWKCEDNYAKALAEAGQPDSRCGNNGSGA